MSNEYYESKVFAQHRVNAAHIAVEAAEHVQMYPEPMEVVVIGGLGSYQWWDLMARKTDEVRRSHYLITGHIHRVDTYHDNAFGSELPQPSSSNYSKVFVIAGQCGEARLTEEDYFALHRNGYWYAWGSRFDSEDAAVDYLVEIARDDFDERDDEGKERILRSVEKRAA